MKFDQLIIGGGVVGLSLAVRLDELGFKVAVVEKSLNLERLQKNGEGLLYFINPKNLLFFQSLGSDFCSAFDEASFDVHKMVVWGDSFSKVTFDPSLIGHSRLGVTLNKEKLISLLHRRTIHSSITLLFNSVIKKINSRADSVSVDLVDGRTIETALLVGADGPLSNVRTKSGIDSEVKDYEQIAVTATISGLPVTQFAYQWFQKGGATLAMLPIAPGRYGLIWCMSKKKAVEFREKGTLRLLDDLLATVDFTGATTRVEGRVEYFPVKAIRPKTSIGQNLALIGDAAGTIHPMAGQGLNLGLFDVQALIEIIERKMTNNSRLTYRDLRQYERKRAERNFLMWTTTNSLFELFSLNLFSVKLLRNAGFFCLNKLSAVKKIMTRLASGGL